MKLPPDPFSKTRVIHSNTCNVVSTRRSKVPSNLLFHIIYLIQKNSFSWEKRIPLGIQGDRPPITTCNAADVEGGLNITTGGYELSRHTSHRPLVFETSGVLKYTFFITSNTIFCLEA